MKLFLTSVFVNTSEKFLNFLGKKPSDLKLAFIPTAADLYKDKWFVEADRNKLIELGFKVTDVSLAGKMKEQIETELSDSDVIFVGGGNTFYLLQEAKKSGFDILATNLVNQGVVYVGSSAGAVLACKNIEPVKGFDDPAEAPELKSYEGLNLIDAIILPHYGNSKDEHLYQSAVKEYEDKYKLILLNDQQAVVVNKEGYQII